MVALALTMDAIDRNDNNDDEADRLLFRALDDSELLSKILGVKSNDPAVKRLELSLINNLGWKAWNRLGCILGQNTTVNEFRVLDDRSLEVAGLFDGLQLNRHIKKLHLYGVNLHGNNLRSLVPFIEHNPNLKEITLYQCSIMSDGIEILSYALLNLSEDTLEVLNLGFNSEWFSDDALDILVQALTKCRKLTTLSLSGNGIGQRGCTSLIALLESPGSILEFLHLNKTSLIRERILVLTKSLANKNTKLKWFDLGKNSSISTGWVDVLKLVCCSTSIAEVIESNHTLSYLGMNTDELMKAVTPTLGVDDANLLHSSLAINSMSKNIAIRRKIIWSHSRNDLNIGDSSIDIPLGAFPSILAWFANDSTEWDADLILYHEPPLSQTMIDIVRLDSVFRILQSQPHVV